MLNHITKSTYFMIPKLKLESRDDKLYGLGFKLWSLTRGKYHSEGKSESSVDQCNFRVFV